MLTHETLVQLYRDCSEEKVLSIYLDGSATDPAQRSVWRRRLDQHIAEAGQGLLNHSAEERAGFEAAVERLKAELDWFDAFLPGKGWVGFATPDRVLYSEAVPTHMPDLVRWERGIRVAPYVRGLKQMRPVLVVLADQRKARVFEYREGAMTELPGVLADTDIGDLTDVGTGKRGGTHSGVRGQTGTDAAQRYLGTGSDRMLKRLWEQLEERIIETDGLLVVGGTPETVRNLAQHASAWMAKRVLERPSLHVDMSLAEVLTAAEASATVLTQRGQAELVTEVLDLARSGGRGCLGIEATEKALREGRVDTLLLTRSFIREFPDFADHCVGTAFDQQADVEELSGAPAARWGRHAGGIGARLRFLIKDQTPLPEGQAANPNPAAAAGGAAR
jgi:hypothetical protein